jgi:hypothetical protein
VPGRSPPSGTKRGELDLLDTVPADLLHLLEKGDRLLSVPVPGQVLGHVGEDGEGVVLPTRVQHETREVGPDAGAPVGPAEVGLQGGRGS